MTNRTSYLRRWTAIAAVLAVTGCAAYSGAPDGYAMGYYDSPFYDGLDGYDGVGIGYGGVYPYGYHEGHRGHVGWDQHAAHSNFAWHGAPGGVQHGFGAQHGGFAHISMAGHGGGMGGHGGGGHGRG